MADEQRGGKREHAMPNSKLPALTIALLAAWTSHANATPMSAQDLISACSGDGMGKATCNGYLMALTDLARRRERRGKGGGKVCLPENVTTDQVRDAVLAFAKQPKAQRVKSGMRLAAGAIRASWPCDGAARPQ
jgi:hypothetical protein